MEKFNLEEATALMGTDGAAADGIDPEDKEDDHQQTGDK